MMMKNIILAVKVLATVSGLISAFLLFYSLNIESSPFKPILTSDGAHLCFNGKLLAAGYGGPLVLDPNAACPGWEGGKPAALIATEHPRYVPWGLGLLLVSFLFQLVDIGFSQMGHNRAS